MKRYGRLAARSQLPDARRLALAVLLCSLAAFTGSALRFARAEAWGSKEPTFVVYSRHQTGTENHDVYLANADGSHEVRLSSWRGDEQTPQFSPDGKTIVFRAARDPGDAPEIWVMNRDGSKKRNLTRTPKQTEWSPTWTPNGRHIVFSCGGADPNGIGDDLCSMDADGSHRRYLLKNPDGSEEYPSFDPAGSRFAYIYYDDRGIFQVWTAASNGRDRRNLTGPGLSATWPVWSPDSSRIAFKRPASGGDIWVMSPNGSGKRNLTRTADLDEQFPAWLPDGRLSFTRGDGTHESSYSLWVMNADGSDQHELIRNVSGWASWTAQN